MEEKYFQEGNGESYIIIGFEFEYLTSYLVIKIQTFGDENKYYSPR